MKCVSNYIFHDQDNVCSSILYAARFHFVDKRSKMVIQKETIEKRFFLVVGVLLKYLTIKSNMFLGRLWRTLDHIEVVLDSEYFKKNEIAKPYESSSSLTLSSCFVWMAFSAFLLFLC